MTTEQASLISFAPTMEERSYEDAIRTERPGPLRRRRQLKRLLEYEQTHGLMSDYLRAVIGA